MTCSQNCDQGRSCDCVQAEESFTRGWKWFLPLCIVVAGLLGAGLSGCKRASVLEAERRAKTFDCISVPTTGDIEAGAKRERATGLAAAGIGRKS